MTRLAILLASIAIDASTIPAVASECTSSRDIDSLRAHWTTMRAQPTRTADHETICRVYATAFYESVKLRQDAASCSRNTDPTRSLELLDLEIGALNDLLATRCGG